jgi:hypothetical protein
MRVAFKDLFTVLPNGMISPKTAVRIGGSQMGPGAAFGPDTAISGVRLHTLQQGFLEVEKDGDVTVIKGHWTPNR